MKRALHIPALLLPILLCMMVSSPTQAQQPAHTQQDSLLTGQSHLLVELHIAADSVATVDKLAMARALSELAALSDSTPDQQARLLATLDSLEQVRNQAANPYAIAFDSIRQNTKGVPVKLFADTVFSIYAKAGPIGPSARATALQNSIKQLANNDAFDPDKLTVYQDEDGTYLMHKGQLLNTITDVDTLWAQLSPLELANQQKEALQTAFNKYQKEDWLVKHLTRFGLLALALLLFYIGVKLFNKAFNWISKQLLERGKNRFVNGTKLQKYNLITVKQIEKLIERAVNLLRWVLLAPLFYVFLLAVFSIFPATKGLANSLLTFVVDLLGTFGSSFVAFIPSLIAIIVIFVIARYVVFFLRLLALEIKSGKLTIPGFYPDWSIPTFNLFRILIFVFAFIIIFPFIPGSDSPAFQGVGVFLGLLISLGSSSAIGNIIAGLVIIYMRAFKIGDRVKIGDVTGEVIEKTMLVTRVRTIKNEDVSIPNSSILIGSTINYSANAEELGLILNTTITIGYDAPWRTVNELLVNAALKTEHIKSEPPPFVLQTSLDDFYVSYQINGYTEEVHKVATIYSELHSNIQDAFNEAGIEILSPHYRAQRDGNDTTIPSGGGSDS